MSEHRVTSQLPGTEPSRWSRGTKIAMASWGVFLFICLAGLIYLMIRVSSDDDGNGERTGSGPITGGLADHEAQGEAAKSRSRLKLNLPGFEFTANNVHFTAPLPDLLVPEVQIFSVPEFPGYSAIWGATGRDHRGHIWMGVSTRGYGEAHLIEFDPTTNKLADHGSVRDQLKRLDLWEKGMSQIKIHSRIVQAPDGYLYFTSMDEHGEKSDGSANPTHGSYLWRVHPLKPAQWQKLDHMPEGLIAVACGGPMVYSLGYHDHVLYQYDTRTGNMRSIKVGSVGGHISRNFVVDHRDHVYVPRLRDIGFNKPISVELVEFDEHLAQVAQTPLEHYLTQSPAQSHGIIAVQPLADRSIVFTTNGGMLYRITPSVTKAAAKVESLGFIHPQGARYVPTLFTDDGISALYAVSLHGDGFNWIRFDLSTKKSTQKPLDVKYPDGRRLFKHLIYGSMARDATGAFFVVGTDQNLDRPVIWRLRPGG